MNMRVDSFDKVENFAATVEIGHQELKKQSDQATRFGKSAFKDHPQAQQVQDALQIIEHKQLMSILASTRDAVFGEGGSVELARHAMPKLAAPKDTQSSDNKSLNTSARLLEQLGRISQLSADNSLLNQLAQSQSYNAMMSGAGDSFNELAAALESDALQWALDFDALQLAKNESSQLESSLLVAEDELALAQSRLAKLEAEAAGQKPVPDDLQKEITRARQELELAQSKVTIADDAFNKHRDNVLVPAIQKESLSKSTLEGSLAQSQKLVASMSPQQQSIIEAQRKQNDQQAVSLTLLIAIISQLISNRASDNLKASAELKLKLSEAAARDSELKAKEYDENVRKSEEMQKTMGCVGKILGWAITAVSFAAAVFTGGASLALAAVGLALTIGDEINQAITGNSFMAEAMKPLMEHIIQPLMEILGKAFSAILESFGVDKSTADFVGKILGAIAAAIVMVAAVMIASSVASKVIGSLTEKLGSKVMDSVVGRMLSKFGQGVGKSLAMDEAKMAQIATKTKMAASGASFINTSLQTAGDIITSNMQLKASKAKAGLINNAALLDLLNELQRIAIEAFKHQTETINATVKNISDIAENKYQAGKFITRQMSSVAG